MHTHTYIYIDELPPEITQEDIVRPIVKKLLQQCTAGAIYNLREQIPREFIAEFLMEQEHFNLK